LAKITERGFYMVEAKPRRRNHPVRLLEYPLPGSWKAWVGRTDADNDYLSLTVARPEDWWFHVRGVPGGHVVLQGPPGEEPDRETLKRAAAIAAYHSKARKAGLVPVSCTRARYVTKPRDAKVGTVQIRKEVVIKVRPGDTQKLARETANESADETMEK
jgi:predicted ribosome quality control (RQC) complex YloA/Tae2 family protein